VARQIAVSPEHPQLCITAEATASSRFLKLVPHNNHATAFITAGGAFPITFAIQHDASKVMHLTLNRATGLSTTNYAATIANGYALCNDAKKLAAKPTWAGIPNRLRLMTVDGGLVEISEQGVAKFTCQYAEPTTYNLQSMNSLQQDLLLSTLLVITAGKNPISAAVAKGVQADCYD
jgi:hypothetical protein